MRIQPPSSARYIYIYAGLYLFAVARSIIDLVWQGGKGVGEEGYLIWYLWCEIGIREGRGSGVVRYVDDSTTDILLP